MKHSIAIAGAGFAGAVLARELAETGRFDITVFDSRNHVAGNCHTERDKETGVMVHEYGPHIFHTSREDVWDYVNRWGKFGAYTNRVKAHTARGVFSLPMNLLTINQFFGKKFTPPQARDFIGSVGDDSIKEPKNFEEQALKFLGRDLYQNFFYGYTKKQWGVEPTELPASILQRLPIRFNYDDNYYNSQYQGIPRDGYTAIVENLLDLPNVSLHLGTRFARAQAAGYDQVFCSGPIDAWFGYDEGRLGYRTLDFVREDHADDYQGNAVINYCDLSVPWTRISEHKHFAPWEQHADTVVFKEYSRLCEGDDTPYYPIRLVAEKALLAHYVQRARRERNVTFVGRLGTYRYIDMHVTIAEALDVAQHYAQSLAAGMPPGSFVVDPLG